MTDIMPKPEELRNTVKDWPRDEYFSDEALNFHTLRDFCRDPKLFAEGYYNKENDDPKRRDAKRQGTQLHELVLEGDDVFNANNALWTPPVNEKTGKPFGSDTKKYTDALAEFKAANQGKESYTTDEWNMFAAMRDALTNHPVAGPYLFPETTEQRAESELKFRGEFCPGWFAKGSIDRYDNVFGIIDLKTCAEIERFDGYKSFEKTCIYSGYIEQLAFYQIMFHELMDPRASADYPPVTIIGVEKKEPYRVAVCQPDDETQAAAREQIYKMLDKYMKAVKEQRFESRYDEIITLHRNY